MVKMAQYLYSSTDACTDEDCTTTICGTVVDIISDTETTVSAYVGTATTAVGQPIFNLISVCFKRLLSWVGSADLVVITESEPEVGFTQDCLQRAVWRPRCVR